MRHDSTMSALILKRQLQWRATPLLLTLVPLWVCAQGAPAEDDPLRLIVTATRSSSPALSLPVSADRIEGSAMQDGRAQVNLSESMGAVPGLVVQNRQNYAQDLQISSRGFGARASFGVRGIRLYSDGIPATMPDGQGQVSHFDIGSAGSVEVMRGPFSVLYGNASGGVISLTTEDGRAGAQLAADLSVGSFDSEREALKATGDNGWLNYVVSASHFRTDGYRDHSAAVRDIANAKLRFDTGEASTLTLVANALDMPDSLDPLGLTSSEWRADPRQASPRALEFDSRKSNSQQQLGLAWDTRLNATDSVHAATWGGQREVRQYQAIPKVAQTSNPRHPGGVIDLDRDYGGLDIRWTRATAELETAVGASYEGMNEQRRGYENFIGNTLGVLGRLRRNEDNTTSNRNIYAQVRWQPGPEWQLLAGMRRSDVRFESNDNYVVGVNADDSGHVDYSETTPALGVSYAVTDATHIYAAWGQGFETPTANELAYRSPTEAGINVSLDAERSTHREVGLKTRLGDRGRLNLAYFDIDTDDEIGQINFGGRAVYSNVGRTRRTGWELAYEGRFDHGFSTQAAYTWLDATYRDNTATALRRGNELPGLPAQSFYGELLWSDTASGFSVALEARANARVWANDENTAAAPSYTIANLRLGLEQKSGTLQWREFLRIDNLSDKDYVGSVIVNEVNQRYFEPSPGRTVLVGVSMNWALP